MKPPEVGFGIVVLPPVDHDQTEWMCCASAKSLSRKGQIAHRATPAAIHASTVNTMLSVFIFSPFVGRAGSNGTAVSFLFSVPRTALVEELAARALQAG